MKRLIMLFLALTISLETSAQIALSQSPWQEELEQYLQMGHSLNESDQDAFQASIVFKIYALPDKDWEPAIQNLGSLSRSHKDEVVPILRKLNSMWVRRNINPLQVRTQQTEAQLIEEGKWFAIASIFLSVTKRQLLPLMIASFLTLQLSADTPDIAKIGRRAPFEILAEFAASPVAVQAEAEQAFINAKADIAAAFAGSIASYILGASESVAGASMGFSNYIRQAFVFTLAAFSVSGVTRIYLNNGRRKDLLVDLKKQDEVLGRALSSNGPNLRAAIKSYVLSVQSLAAFDSLKTVKFQNESGNETLGTSIPILQNDCTDRVDKALLVKAVETGRTDDEDQIVRLASPMVQWELNRWAAQFHYQETGQAGFRSKPQMASAVTAFLRNPSKNRHFLEQLKAEVMTWDFDCSDGLYDLFKGVERLNAFRGQFGSTFNSISAAEQGPDLLYENYSLQLMGRRSLIEGMRMLIKGRTE